MDRLWFAILLFVLLAGLLTGCARSSILSEPGPTGSSAAPSAEAEAPKMGASTTDADRRRPDEVHASQAYPNLGVWTTPTLEVYHVYGNSAADIYGIRVGDVLLNMRTNGELPDIDRAPMPFSTAAFADAKRFIGEAAIAEERAAAEANRAPQHPLIVTVLRDGEQIEIPLTPHVVHNKDIPNPLPTLQPVGNLYF